MQAIPRKSTLVGCELVIFKRVRIAANCALYLTHVHPSVHLSECITTAPTGQIAVEYTCRLAWKFIDSIQAWLKPRKISGTLQWRPKNVLLLPATLSRNKSSLFEWKLSSCLDSQRGIKIRRTRHNVTFSILYTDFGRPTKSVLSMTVCLTSTTLTCVTRLILTQTLQLAW
jgi:hypothetical protein